MSYNVKDFFTKNHEKGLTFKLYIYSFYYRFIITHVKMSKVERKMGEKGAESPREVSVETRKYAKLVAFHANRITEHMPWEAKCYTRSLTIARALKDKGIESTIYMGISSGADGMTAHSWIRCGNLYLTNPMLDKYVVVATFRY